MIAKVIERLLTITASAAFAFGCAPVSPEMCDPQIGGLLQYAQCAGSTGGYRQREAALEDAIIEQDVTARMQESRNRYLEAVYLQRQQALEAITREAQELERLTNHLEQIQADLVSDRISQQQAFQQIRLTLSDLQGQALALKGVLERETRYPSPGSPTVPDIADPRICRDATLHEIINDTDLLFDLLANTAYDFAVPSLGELAALRSGEALGRIVGLSRIVVRRLSFTVGILFSATRNVPQIC